jgi:DNA-binding FadR family transcriptional regulator
MFKKVQVGRASDEAVEQIEQAIYAGKLTPGDRLPPERELAEIFGLSRMTIRDALRILESNGLVEIRLGANGGAFVREPNFGSLSHSISSMIKFKRATLLELAEARKIIETATAELAAKRATEEDLEAMRLAVEEADEAFAEDDTYYMPHSVAFHVALAKAANNYLLELTVQSFRTLFFNVLEQLLPTTDMAERAITDHRAIYEAVKARDGALARRLMAEHLTYFEQQLTALEDDSLLVGEA